MCYKERSNEKTLYYFPPHLTNASVLGKEETQKLVFSLAVLPANTQNTFKISPDHIRTTLHCQSDRMHQTGPIGGEHSILQYVTLTLDVICLC